MFIEIDHNNVAQRFVDSALKMTPIKCMHQTHSFNSQTSFTLQMDKIDGIYDTYKRHLNFAQSADIEH